MADKLGLGGPVTRAGDDAGPADLAPAIIRHADDCHLQHRGDARRAPPDPARYRRLAGWAAAETGAEAAFRAGRLHRLEAGPDPGTPMPPPPAPAPVYTKVVCDGGYGRNACDESPFVYTSR